MKGEISLENSEKHKEVLKERDKIRAVLIRLLGFFRERRQDKSSRPRIWVLGPRKEPRG